MSLKSFGAKIFAAKQMRKISRWKNDPIRTQEKVFKGLIHKGKNTLFGKDHNFSSIVSYEDFALQVPIKDYEGLRPYVDQVVAGKSDVLWPGLPLYFAKTSGTTSGAKYIPLTKDSITHHTDAARDSILSYIAETGNSAFVNGKMIFLQGSPELDEKNGIKVGRLSGIVAHYVPNYLLKNRLPSWETNSIEDWETKVEAIVRETQDEDMTVISGIPSWVQMYFERLKASTGKDIGVLFKNLQLFIYGGVNYEPYRSNFEKLLGRKVDSIELYPASEGFFAYQDKQNESGMLLLLDSGIFYEFVELSHFFDDNPKRLTIGEVKIGINYVMIISTDAGLWGYNLGDTVQFTSLSPFKLIVSGRIKHFISAFGEHVIGKEVEDAINYAINVHQFSPTEFTVAPQINPKSDELPHHEWLIEFDETPSDLARIAKTIDKELQKQNSYYRDLIEGKILQTLSIRPLPKGSFNNWMKSEGKLGGQNKIPRLSNDRKIADSLLSTIAQN